MVKKKVLKKRERELSTATLVQLLTEEGKT